MRVVIESGSWQCVNMGDVAMLQAAVARTRRLWPRASIGVFTSAPEALARYCPDVEPLSTDARGLWLRANAAAGRPTSRIASSCLEVAVRTGLRVRGRHADGIRTVASALRRADLVLGCGMAVLSDGTAAHARVLLDTLELAIARGVPTVLFGQGIGPLDDPELRARGSAVLPGVDLIAVREARTGPGILAGLGVDRSRIVVTGDDAVDAAYEARSDVPGSAIGVNVRVSRIAGTALALAHALRRPLHELARRLGAELLPVPITRGAAHDVQVLRDLLQRRGAGADEDGGVSLDTPGHVIAQVARCRVVVTGAYHAAVFALAQGIPAVCLAGSTCYRQKFLGLADLFGPGCQVLTVPDAVASGRFGPAVEDAWHAAERHREPLLAAAERQIALTDAALGRVADLVGAPTVPPAARSFA